MDSLDITRSERPGNLPDEGVFTGFCGQIDDLADRRFGWINCETPMEAGETCAPYVNIKEMDDVFQLDAELPGMDQEDIHLSVQNDVLTLRGEKKTEKEDEAVSCRYIERQCASFARDFALPDTADVDRIQAVFKNGVLRITLPKTQQVVEEAKQIPVSAA